MFDTIENLKNDIDFYLRNKLTFSRKNFVFKNESKDRMFDSEEKIVAEKYLFEKFSLLKMKNFGTRNNYLENLDVLEILDKYLKLEKRPKLRVLDIGSKSWNYAKAEYYFFSKCADILDMTGIEIDSNRLYSNLYSRKQVALANIKTLKKTKYISGNFIGHSGEYDVITWFLPFVYERPHRKWGLPNRHFRPSEMLAHAYDLLSKNGIMLVVNQGLHEYEKQQELYNMLSIDYIPIGEIDTTFEFYPVQRYLSLVKK